MKNTTKNIKKATKNIKKKKLFSRDAKDNDFLDLFSFI